MSGMRIRLRQAESSLHQYALRSWFGILPITRGELSMADKKQYICALHLSVQCGFRAYAGHGCTLDAHSNYAQCPHRMQALLIQESPAEKIVADEIKAICE
jgi:hypothetical protein